MNTPTRRTLVVPDRLALRTKRLQAARTRQHGLQVMEIDQLAARLAGGFVRSIDADSLRLAIQAVLPNTALGELDAIKSLPGMVNAAARTLDKVWLAGIDLQARAIVHPRLAALARLEQAVLDHLPRAMERPGQIASAAMERLMHAPAVLTSVEVEGVADIAPCWRALLLGLATQIPLRWIAGPHGAPAWLEGHALEIVRLTAAEPAVSAVSAATPAHEALEAMRWIRELLASGQAQPGEIAIVSADPSRFDAHLLALRADAGIDLHFVHGVPVTTTRDGQAASALADILVRGLSQVRLRRLTALFDSDAPLLRALPDHWLRVLPADAALTSPQSWDRLRGRLRAADWPDGVDHGPAFFALISLLQQGPGAAESVGEQVLRGRALSLWRRALVAGPAASLMATLESMKQDEGSDPCTSVAWMPAAALAGTPRRFVRLLGLNSGEWPRANAEDGLLPDHVISADELDPLPRAVQDCRAFEAILFACESQAVFSFSRRNDDGRSLGKSPLLAGAPQPAYLRRHAIPLHAMSETDRLAARPSEFRDLPLALAAAGCWGNWLRPTVTAHDGAVQPGHPLLLAIANRTHSASSLKRLLRNPIGYLWEYGLRWDAPDFVAEPLMLDAATTGNLVHAILDIALQRLEQGGGLAQADASAIGAAVDAAGAAVAAEWEGQIQLPPAMIWRRALEDARHLACAALGFGHSEIAGVRSFGEVAFGGALPKAGAQQPWDAAAPITIPDTPLRIAGYIDRLDISRDGRQAWVRDYKTGKPVANDVVIGGGAELQRCLYAYAVTAMLGRDLTVRASLLYPREMMERELDDPGAVMETLTGHLAAAYDSLVAGHCLAGPDTGGQYDKFAFLLPANALATYYKRKAAAIHAALGDAASVWEVK